MSPEATDVIRYMLVNLSGLKYCYRDIIEGAYEAAIGTEVERVKFGGTGGMCMAIPTEPKEEIVDFVLKTLQEMR